MQYHKLREEWRVQAADLLNTDIAGSVTTGGVCSNAATVLAYAGAWIGGNGCIPLNWLMEDAATAEISRVQLWQWVHYAVRTEDGEPVTVEGVDKLLDEVVPEVRKAVPALKDEHLAIVKDYVKAQIRQTWPSEFLTSDLMPYLAQADGVPAKFQKASL